MNDLISRQAAIDTLNVGTELLRRVLDDADVVGAEREKYEWGLELIESYISDMKELPSAQPERLTDDDLISREGEERKPGEQIDKAIKNCYWRIGVGGVDVCKGA